MAAGHGGARPGAGRKRKAETFASEIAQAERQIADRLPKLIENMMRLADGVKVAEDTAAGVIVYDKPPDSKANQYLIDRILGRPTQALEVGGEDGGPLKIVVEYADVPGSEHLEGDPPEAASGPGEDPPGDEAF